MSNRNDLQLRMLHGFTLVELLVVVGIIALLLSILLPGFSKIRGIANQTKCQSIIRQFNLANDIYAHESNGWFVPIRMDDPPSQDVVAGSPYIRWYQNPAYRDAMNFNIDVGSGGYYPRDFICPDATLAIAMAIDGMPRIDESYGFNQTGVQNLRDPGGSLNYNDIPLLGVKRSDLDNPGAKLQYADAIHDRIERSGSDDYVGEVDMVGSITAYRHPGEQVNVLFFDGHIDALNRTEVDRSEAQQQANRTLWVLNQ